MDSKSKIQDVNSNESAASSIQQPGEIIRPVAADGAVGEILLRVYGLTVVETKELNSYDDRNYFVMVDEKHSNKAISRIYQHGYILKITNTKDSQNQYFHEAQHSFMAHLARHGIPTQGVVPNLNGENYSLEEIYANNDRKDVGGRYIVELRTFIPGRILKDAPYTPDLLIQNGQVIAKIALALKDFDHIFYKTRDILWSLTNVPLLTNYTFCLEDRDRRVVEEVVDAFNTEVVLNYHTIPKGYIHGDPNEQNILVSEDASSGQYNICGIIDFSDVSNSYNVFDLAMLIAYLMIDSDVVDQLDAPGYILAGYLRTRDLTPAEWAALPFCIAGRLAQSLTLGAHAHHLEPENEYVLTTAKKGWPLLYSLWSYSSQDLIGRWKSIVRSISATGNKDVET